MEGARTQSIQAISIQGICDLDKSEGIELRQGVGRQEGRSAEPGKMEGKLQVWMDVHGDELQQ